MKTPRAAILAAAAAVAVAASRSGSEVACAGSDRARKMIGLRCCRDRETRKPYAIHLWHTDGGFRGLSKAHMYEPIRETLRRGLEARADECGYEVSVTIFKASDGTPRAISDGDVVIYFGSYGFRVPAIGALRDGGVSIIKFETEPGRPPTDGALMPWETPSAKQRGALIENWSYTHAYASKNPRHRIVPPGYIERFPRPPTTPGPVGHFSWLGIVGRCMDQIPRDVQRRVSQHYNVRTYEDWEDHMSANHTVYLSLHKESCPSRHRDTVRPSREQPMEYFRLSSIISAGGVVVSEPSHPADEAALEGMVLFEPEMRTNASGSWTAATRTLLHDGPALAAWRDRAVAAYAREFQPVELLRKADAWNEQPRADIPATLE
mmetsp:Transcript_5160/g.15188  ORF Transcript_5160/g.15188 Transcript_5160/m.15188 type:complete len:378 (-) Transcript_5160:178-1311(-)